MPGAMTGASTEAMALRWCGLGLIMAAVGTLLSLVLEESWCLIYLPTAKDLDVSAVEAEMQAKLRKCAHRRKPRASGPQQNVAARHGVGDQARRTRIRNTQRFVLKPDRRRQTTKFEENRAYLSQQLSPATLRPPRPCLVAACDSGPSDAEFMTAASPKASGGRTR